MLIYKDKLHIFFEKSGRASKDNNDVGTGSNTPLAPELYMFDASVRCGKVPRSGMHYNNKLARGSRGEGTAMSLKCCPNSETIKKLQVSFGELFRIGIMGSDT